MYGRVGSVWRSLRPWVKVSSSWKEAVVWVKVSGAWKLVSGFAATITIGSTTVSTRTYTGYQSGNYGSINYDDLYGITVYALFHMLDGYTGTESITFQLDGDQANADATFHRIVINGTTLYRSGATYGYDGTHSNWTWNVTDNYIGTSGSASLLAFKT